MRGDSEHRDLFFIIVNLVYDPVALGINSKMIFAFGQLFGRPRPWITRQRADRPKNAAALGPDGDRLIFPDDAGLDQKLITCHDVADQTQMN